MSKNENNANLFDGVILLTLLTVILFYLYGC